MYTATQAGDYDLSVSVLVDGGTRELLSNAPTKIRVFAAQTDPSLSTMRYDDELSVVAPIVVTLTCKDKYGNARDSPGTVAMRHGSTGFTNIRQLDCTDGLGRISLRSTASGLHSLSAQVEVDGESTHVRGSPAEVTLQPGPVDITKTAWVNYNGSAVMTGEHVVLLQASDKHGNPVNANDLEIDTHVTVGARSADSVRPVQTDSAIRQGAGAYRSVIVVTRAGRYMVSHAVRDAVGNAIQLGPVDLFVGAGPVDLASTLLDAGALRGAVAGEPLTFRARLSDGRDNARTESDHVELSLLDQDGVARITVQGTTKPTNWKAFPAVPGGLLAEEYVVHTAGVYTPRFRVNHALEYVGPTMTVTFGAPGAARVSGWRELHDTTVLAVAGVPENFVVHSLDSFGNARTVHDLSVYLEMFDQGSQGTPTGCATAYSADKPGQYRVVVQCPTGTYEMAVSTASALVPEVLVPARVDEVNTADGIQLVVVPSHAQTDHRPGPQWLIRPRWYQSAGTAVQARRPQGSLARRLQVDIDYAIELELQESDLSALLADGNANASALDASLAATLDARMAAAAAMMTGGNFTTMLAASVNEAQAAMAAGCTANADAVSCADAGCRFAAYAVAAIDGVSDPQSITLAAPDGITSGLVHADTVIRVVAAASLSCGITVSDSEGAIVNTTDDATGVVTFLPLGDTTTQLTALANFAGVTDPSSCVFTTCVPNVTLVSLDASSIVNEAPNITELLASVVVETPGFSGSATLQGSALQRVVCGESESITASVYDSFNNLQTAGTDQFDFQWVALCIPTVSGGLQSVADACGAADMSGTDGGEAACLTANPGCTFSSGTATAPIPTITFNTSTSVYAFSFEIQNCEGAVHFLLTVNGVNVTTEATSSQLAPRSIACVPGDISSAHTTATARSQSATLATIPSITAGQRESIDFTAADRYNNVKLTGGDGEQLVLNITVPAHGQEPEETITCGGVDPWCGMADFNNGRYQAEYQVRYVGTYTVSILVLDSGGTASSIVNSPVSATVIEGPMVPGLTNLLLSAVALPVGPSGGTLTVEQFDAYANPVPNAPQAQACSATDTSMCNRFYLLVGNVEGADPTDPLVLPYSSDVSGAIVITAFFKDGNGVVSPAGLPQQRSTVVTFAAGDAVLDNSAVIAGSGRTVDCIAGALSEFVIQTRDVYGNDCLQNYPTASGNPSQCPGPSAICPWAVSLLACQGNTQADELACLTTGQQTVYTVQDNGAGQYTIQYTARNTGYYKVSVTVNGQDLSGSWLAGTGSPFVILSDTAAVADACVVINTAGQTGLTSTTSGVEATFTLQANGRDAANNPITRRGSGEQFAITVLGQNVGLEQQSQEYQGLGRYLMRYTANATGYDQENWAFTVNVKLRPPGQPTAGGDHINGSPFQNVEMTPSVTAAQYTTASGGALAVGVTGIAGMIEVFGISARDAYDNAATQCVPDLTSFNLQLAQGGVSALVPSVRGCTATPFAAYEVEFRVTVAGTYALDAGYLGAPLNGSPHSIVIGSSTVSAMLSFVAITAEYRSPVSGFAPGVPAMTGDFPTRAAGEEYTFFLHAFDRFTNRLTQNVCAGETGVEAVACVNFAFRWCQLGRDVSSIDASLCYVNAAELNPQASMTKVAAEGPGVYTLATAVGATGLSRSGGYRVDVTIDQADGVTAAANNSHFLLAVEPAAADALQTIMQPPLTIMASQWVTFEMAARDEFQNSVQVADLQWNATFVCTLAIPSADACNSALGGTGVQTTTQYIQSVNRYEVSFYVDSGGNGATLNMTILLGTNPPVATGAPECITVRAAQNEPSLCYVISPEAGTAVQRATAVLPSTDAAYLAEYTARDCLNLDRKIVGQALTFVVQSVLAAGSDREFTNPDTVCTPDDIAAQSITCDRLDEFEVVAFNQVTQQQTPAFRDDCETLTPSSYAISKCVTQGEYAMSWNTNVAGDWEVTIRSLGVIIQTEALPADGGRADRFDRSNLVNTGYLFVDPQSGAQASFITHVYPAPMSAATSQFELSTPCSASTPCMQMGSAYGITILAMDQYGNQLENETDSTGQLCPAVGCLAQRLRATLTTQCGSGDSLCTAYALAFEYDHHDNFPGHLRSSVMPAIAGLAKLTLEFESGGAWEEFASGKKAAVVLFAVDTPSPNAGFIGAGDSMLVEAAIYGFLEPAATVSPTFFCEWVGAAVGGVHSTPATLMDDARPNLASMTMTILGGGTGVSWVLESRNAATQLWDPIFSSRPLGTYTETSPCGESWILLKTVAEEALGADPRQAAVVNWAAGPDCSSALAMLGKYGLTCEVRPTLPFTYILAV